MGLSGKENIEKNEQKFFDEFYKGGLTDQKENLYSEVGWQIRLERELAKITTFAKSSNKRFRRVLSIGCGEGQFELMLAPFADEIIAIDLSSEAIQFASNRAKSLGIANVHFECISVLDAKWVGEFDLVISLAFFHHISESDLPGLLKRLQECLKPGGILYSTDPNINAFLRKLGRILMGKSYDKFHSPDERELSPEEMVEDLRKAGFKRITLSWTDFMLIPSAILFKKGPGWFFRLCRMIDALLARSPFRIGASSFGVFAERD